MELCKKAIALFYPPKATYPQNSMRALAVGIRCDARQSKGLRPRHAQKEMKQDNGTDIKREEQEGSENYRNEHVNPVQFILRQPPVNLRKPRYAALQ
jgi:hypothetical protein